MSHLQPRQFRCGNDLSVSRQQNRRRPSSTELAYRLGEGGGCGDAGGLGDGGGWVGDGSGFGFVLVTGSVASQIGGSSLGSAFVPCLAIGSFGKSFGSIVPGSSSH